MNPRTAPPSGRTARLLVVPFAVAALTACSNGGGVEAGAAVPITSASAGQSSGAPAGESTAGGAAASTGAVASTGSAEPPAEPTQDVTDEGTIADARPSAAPAPSLDVVLTYATFVPDTDSFEVGALVPGVLESDGTCTLTLTQAGRPAVSADRPAEPDVRDTSCGSFVLPRGGLDPASVTAEVSYRSGRSSGRSAPATVDVP